MMLRVIYLMKGVWASSMKLSNYLNLFQIILLLSFDTLGISFAMPGMPSQPLGIFNPNAFSELSEIENYSVLSSLATSTLSLFHKDYLMPISQNTFLIKAWTLNSWEIPLSNGQTFQAPFCPEVSLKNQPSGAYCSGALVAPQRVVTSGHCVQTSVLCNEMKIVFGFNDLNLKFRTKQEALLISKDEIFSCKKVLFKSFSENLDDPDIALIELDRPVPSEKHRPIAIARTTPQINTPVVSFGSPLGVPTKLSQGGRVLGVETNYITTSLSALSSSSGGVVIELKNNQAIGVISKGEADVDANGNEMPFTYDVERNCATWNILKNPTFWTRVTPLSALPESF
jgi:hypothetical protein